MKRASIALAAALIASSGCIIEKTSSDVSIYWSALQDATILSGADRLRIRVTGVGSDGDDEEIGSASFSADANGGHLKIPFGEGIVVHVEVLDSDGDVISYGASRRHHIASPDTEENDLDPGWELPPDEIPVFIAAANSTTNTVTSGGLPAYDLEEHWGHTATPLPDGRILIVGGAKIGNPLAAFPYGQIAANSISARVELFDPETGTYTGVAKPTMDFDVLSNARAFHTATLLDDGSVLILGGYSFIEDTLVGLRTAETFDVDSCDFSGAAFAICNTVPVQGVMEEARAFHTATLLSDGTVLVAGGIDDHTGDHADIRYLSSALRWDPSTRLFADTNPMARRRAGHTASALDDDRVFIIGGLDPDCDPPDCQEAGRHRSVEVYNAGSFELRSEFTMNTPRAMHSAHVVAKDSDTDLIVVIGGYTAVDGAGYLDDPVALVEVIDPDVANLPGWARTIRGPTGSEVAIADHGAVTLEDGRIILVGGTGSGGISTTFIGCVALGQNALEIGSGVPMGSPRTRPAVAALLSGAVLISGGYSNSGTPATLNLSEVYTPYAEGCGVTE